MSYIQIYIVILVLSTKPAVLCLSVVCFTYLFYCLHSDVKQMDRVRLQECVGTFNSLTRVTMEALSAACLSAKPPGNPLTICAALLADEPC